MDFVKDLVTVLFSMEADLTQIPHNDYSRLLPRPLPILRGDVRSTLRPADVYAADQRPH